MGARRGGEPALLPPRAGGAASTSSTPPTCTRTGVSEEVTRPRPEGLGAAATRSCSPPRSSTRWATARTSAACRASTSCDAIDASLQRLGTDYVDLYQIHRFDPDTPIEETLAALDDVVRAGKALYIGASSMYAWQFAKMLAVSDRLGWARFVTMQNHYNLVYREEEREMIPLCRSEGIGVMPWSPLARGFLAGTPQAGREDSAGPYGQLHGHARDGLRAGLCDCRAGQHGCGAARVQAGPDCAGLGAGLAGRDLAHCGARPSRITCQMPLAH